MTSRERQKAIVDLMPWAQKIARAVSRQHCDEDSVADAYVGLVQAVDMYDQADEYFEQKAYLRIAGAVIDGIRTRKTLHRGDARGQRRLERVERAFAARHHRFPTDSELAGELGVDVGEVAQLRERLNRGGILSLNEPAHVSQSRDVRELIDVVIAPDDDAERDLFAVEDRDMLARLLPNLNWQEHFAVALFYWQDLTQVEIAEMLGVTCSRVSQILSAAVAKMRLMLAVAGQRAA